MSLRVPWDLLLLPLGGGVSEPTAPGPVPHSLGASTILPREEIARFYSPADWRSLRDFEFTGYVVTNGTIEDNRRVAIRQITQACPDTAYVRRAREMATGVRISSLTIDSGIRPQAEVFVIFDESLFGRMTLIYARRTDYSPKGGLWDGKLLGTSRL